MSPVPPVAARRARRAAAGALVASAALALAATGRLPAAAEDASPCPASATRTVAPATVTVGQPATVTAVLRIGCPALAGPLDVALALDRSASMLGESLAAAKHAAGVFVDVAELGRVRVAVVAFDDRATIEVPLSSWHSRLRGAIASIQVPPAAGTDLVRALAAGGRALDAGAGDGRAGRLAAMILLTDGQNNGGRVPVLQQAAVQRANGVHLTTISLGRRADRDLLAQVATTPADHWPAPTRDDLAAIYARLPGHLDRLAVRSIDIDDVVGATLALREGTSRPPASLAGGRQRFTIPAAAADAVTITYGIVASQPGRWPVSAGTQAIYTDVTGRTGSVAVPVPILEVVAVPTPGTAAPATATAAPTRPGEPTTTPTATAAPPTATATAAHPPPATAAATATATPGAARHRRFLPVALAGACLPGAVPLDLVVVVDTSTTMLGRTASGERKLDLAVDGIGRLVDGLSGRASTRIGVVRFSAAAAVWSPLTADLAAVRRALAEPIAAGQGSRIDLGLRLAVDLFADDTTAGPPYRAVVLASDGLVFGATPADVRDAADSARRRGAVAYAVGVGPGADRALLAAVAGDASRTFDAGDGDGFAAAFRAVVAALPCARAAP